MAILLLRHATAGSRSRWKGDDRERPLDRRGRLQAKRLRAHFAEFPVTRILTSPYVRCVETVRPLAKELGLELEVREELAEGLGAGPSLALLRELGGETAVVCTHGDVILDLVGGEQPAKKGSTWILEATADGFAPAVYLPPPA